MPIDPKDVDLLPFIENLEPSQFPNKLQGWLEENYPDIQVLRVIVDPATMGKTYIHIEVGVCPEAIERAMQE
ncbi:MAG: hypothetical protein ABSG46_20320 [Candidatus Binataceae bacterium]|jgi:hypothetical protein